MATIRIKRGLQANIKDLVLQEGEMAVALDTGNVYIGTTSGNTWLNPTGGTADNAVTLKTPRNFSITGDGSASAVSFDGSANVALNLVLNAISGLTAGTYTKLTVNAKGQVTAGTTLSVTDLPDAIPYTKLTGVPSKVSTFTNDAGYQTAEQVSDAISNVVGAAPEALNTLKELADALGSDANFSTTVTNSLAGKEPLVKNAAAKTSVVADDTIIITDSASSNATKRITLATLEAGIKTYFDTLYNKYTHPAYSGKSSGLYKITVDATGHVSAAAAVTKADITALGIPAQDTVYNLPTASSSVLGGVKVGAGLTISSGLLAIGDIDCGTF